ncbi:MAG: helix-hairpin-helix domain-containing protein [Deltaproteobacteria bacterium]|nr:helix-hairpin-helix domain-containing protein [Deltaproteobacteria bacterium]
MDPLLKKLTRLRGVGVVLAARLQESGLDSIDKIIAEGADGLHKIRGINPRAIPAILAQAAEMVAEESEKTVTQVVDRTLLLSIRVQEIAKNVRERFGEELKGKTGKKVEKEILKIAAFLDPNTLKIQKKRVVKGLAKAEKKLVVAEDTSLKKIRKCLKRTRKSLNKISSQR